MPTAHSFRWRPVLAAISLTGFALPGYAVDATSAAAAKASPTPGGAPAPAKQEALAATHTGPVATTGTAATTGSAAKLPGNDPSLFASSIPTNSGPALAGAAPDGPSTSFAVNLLQKLVEKGILKQDEANQLKAEAEHDTEVARAQAQTEAQVASQAVITQVKQDVAAMTPPAPAEDEIRVPYIPEVVKKEMRDEIRHDVIAQARSENWAQPNAIPDWVPRFRFSGDIRTRYEGDFYSNSNDNTGAFPNFNSINTGAPFDVAGTNFSPQYNVNQDRERFRIRARIGADIDLQDGFTAGIRLATGQDDSPVTENQTLGLANGGQGGNFSKYSIWLDRAFLKYQYQADDDPNKQFTATIGRMDNPFFSTTMIWARDLGFDGLTLQGRYPIVRGLVPFLTVGAYPVFNTDFNFASNQPAKYQSEDKYLFAAQIGADWTVNKDFNAKVAGALYYFDNVEGHLSSPFTPLSASDQGNTDDSRPSFAQNGNTYFPIRDIVPTAQNSYGTLYQYQYYGLATPFHELDFTGQLNYDHFAPYRISLIGEFTYNYAFNASKINAVAVNNRSATSATGALGTFDGGNSAWIVTLRGGHATLEKLGDWSFDIGYRYVESDALVDGFADSDFGSPLTGTNLKGYTVGGELALGKRVWLGLHWMSADAIIGPPYSNQLIQLDINGKF